MSLPYISPISAQLVQNDTVMLTDMSGQGLIDIRGRDLGGVFQAIRIGEVNRVENGLLTRLTPEQWLMLVETDNDVAADWLQLEAGATRVTITDVTHGNGYMRVMGQRARDVLPKICGLDFKDSAFPNQHSAQSSLAKVRTLIIRLDEGNLPAFHLIVGSSLAVYVWGVVSDAMQEFSE